MARVRYEAVLREAQQLSAAEQLRLLEALAGSLRQQLAGNQQYSILELEGLGAEVWEGVDAARYIEEERDSWTR